MTEDWVTFEGRIKPMVWGGSTHTILRLPAEVVTALRPASDDVIDLDQGHEVALRGAGLSDHRESLMPGHRRGLLHQICTAKSKSTRAKRIAKLPEEVS